VGSRSGGCIRVNPVSGSCLDGNCSDGDIESVWDSEFSWDEGGESPRAGESPQAAAAIRGYVEGSGASPSAVVATLPLEPQPVTSASVNKEGGVVGVFTETPATWEELARSTSNSRGSRNSSRVEAAVTPAVRPPAAQSVSPTQNFYQRRRDRAPSVKRVPYKQ